MQNTNTILLASAVSKKGIAKLEAKYRFDAPMEVLPFAKGTSYVEIATQVMPDKDATPANPIAHKLYVVRTQHLVRTGLQTLLIKTNEFWELMKKKQPLEILSVSGGREKASLFAVVLLRLYVDEKPNVQPIYEFLGERKRMEETEEQISNRLNVESVEPIEYSNEELQYYHQKMEQQRQVLQNASEEQPYLNTLTSYTREYLPTYDEQKPLMYLLEEKERRTVTMLTYDEFSKIFAEAMTYVTQVERDAYYNVLRGNAKQENFMGIVKDYVENTFILDRKKLSLEDLPILLKKMKTALFEMYIIQDLIDDPQITDVKITDPYSIRVRIRGKAYLSDVSFLNDDDYMRFINMLVIRNNIDPSVPEQTFTDDSDMANILRFTITMPYISSNGYPVLHIRKIPRQKLLSNDLIQVGMMDEKIRDYLLDCGRNSTGVIFAGPPGSGKTVALNWFLEEAYEDSAEILVIQENDELFAYRKGVMFQHVVNNPVEGQRPCTLEDLGQLALVAGANVFIIGEAKGGEICSAITLSNSGCRTAMTIHSRSSTETVDKMADLAMRGYANNYEQAKRMLQSFQIIVYLENFKIQEISEIVGFDEDKKDMIYRPIYRRLGVEEH